MLKFSAKTTQNVISGKVSCTPGVPLDLEVNFSIHSISWAKACLLKKKESRSRFL
jgi:hypothetical protein